MRGRGSPALTRFSFPPFPWFFMENQTKGMGGEPRVELLLEELENQRFFNAFNGKSTNECEGGITGGFPPFPPHPQRKVVNKADKSVFLYPLGCIAQQKGRIMKQSTDHEKSAFCLGLDALQQSAETILDEVATLRCLAADLQEVSRLRADIRRAQATLDGVKVPASERRTERQSKWDRANMRVISGKLPVAEAAAFEKACSSAGISMYSVLIDAARNFTQKGGVHRADQV